MRWSWRIGNLAGISVYIHATFLLIILWAAVVGWQTTQTIEGAFSSIVFILLLFLCVVLHELGHALTARKYGIKTRDITLLPIGGVARLERMPDQPLQELWVALAGPAVNVVIAALMLVWLSISRIGAGMETLFDPQHSSLVERLFTTNIALVIFNLLPAFPMDGGRVVRALLATRMPYVRATQIAANLGQVMAFGFALIGLVYQPVLILIALFVWIGASQESNLVQLKSALNGIPVSDAMLTNFRVITPEHTLDDTIRLTLAGSQTDFPVIENGQIVGILTQSDMLTGLSTLGRDVPVREVMHTEFEVTHPSDMLHSLFLKLQSSESDCRTALVLRHGQLVGLVTKQNIAEYLEIHAALAERAIAPSQPQIKQS